MNGDRVLSIGAFSLSRRGWSQRRAADQRDQPVLPAETGVVPVLQTDQSIELVFPAGAVSAPHGHPQGPGKVVSCGVSGDRTVVKV